MSRKNDLKAMFSGGAVAPAVAAAVAETLSQTSAAQAAPAPLVSRTASGAVKAMGLALGDMAQRASETDRLKAELAVLQAGQGSAHQGDVNDAIVEIDANLIDPSPFADRLSEGAVHDPSFTALVASIRDSGQLVPVLLRQSLNKKGRYQTAYGHRRVRAMRQLAMPVRCIIRPLNDAELMLAQGKENAERRDLSFIEKALFARTLTEAGFGRGDVQSALGIHNSELTRLLQVAAAVPQAMIRAIGPAPKAGRQRWQVLGEFLLSEANAVKAQDEINLERFFNADSDTRFKLLFDRLAPRSKTNNAPTDRVLIDAGGASLGRYLGGREPKIIFSEELAPFAEWLANNLAEVRNQFLKDKTG